MRVVTVIKVRRLRAGIFVLQTKKLAAVISVDTFWYALAPCIASLGVQLDSFASLCVRNG